MRSLLIAICIVLVPRAPSAGALLMLGEPGEAAEYEALVVSELEARGEHLVDEDSLRASWLDALVVSVDADRDAAFVAFHERIAEGRIQFFENEFEAAIEILAPSLGIVEHDPSLLSVHPDLAPEFLEGLLTLVRCYDVLEMAEQSANAMERISQVMWGAEPNPDIYPQAFVQEYRRHQGLIPTRAVTVSWPSDGCRLRLNGFVVAESSGTEVRVPAGDHFLTLECADARSHVVRLAPDQADLRFHPGFDEAVRFLGGSAVINPRDLAPPSIRSLGTQINHLLRLGTLYMVRVADAPSDDQTGWLELARVDADAGFRAVRVVIGDPNAEVRIRSAVEYLVTGETSRGVAVWDPDAGWTEPAGIVVVKGARSPVPWALGGTAAAAGLVAVIFELRTRESVSDIDTCADSVPFECDPGALPSLRSDARTSRSVANAAWIAAGTLAMAGVTFAILKRSPRDRGHASVRFRPLPAGAGVTLIWSR